MENSLELSTFLVCLYQQQQQQEQLLQQQQQQQQINQQPQQCYLIVIKIKIATTKI